MAILGGVGAANGPTNASAGTAPGRDFIEMVYVLSEGLITDFQWYQEAYTSGTIKLKVWRDSGSNYVFVGESQSITPTGAGFQSADLTTPIYCQDGDLIGIWISVGGSSANAVSFSYDLVNDGSVYSGYVDYTSDQPKTNFTDFAGRSFNVTVNGSQDIFVVVGDSNAQGVADNAQSYTGSQRCVMYRQDDTWADLADPTDSDTSDGSIWPLLANLLDADGKQATFITTAKGGTDIYSTLNSWQKGNAEYTEMASQISSSGIPSNAIKGFICHIGTNASLLGATPTYAGYKAALEQFASDLYNDYGAPLIVTQLGAVTSGSPPDRRAALDNIRKAIYDSSQSSGTTHVYLGPTLYDLHIEEGGHYTRNAEVAIIAQRWHLSLNEHLYGGASKSSRGPALISATVNGAILLASFDKSIKAGTGSEGFRITEDGIAVTILSVSIYSSEVIEIILGQDFSGTTVLYIGSENDGYENNVPTDSDDLPAVANFVQVTVEDLGDRYGNNYDYGQSPFYKDEEQPLDGGDNIAIITNAATFEGIIVSI